MKKKILVVDDNRIVLKFLSNLLNREGHEVKTCEDGLSALSLLTDYQPDIAFIDLIIPKIGGDKLCQIIRTMEHMHNCYLVIVSAAVADMDLDYKSIGVNACIAKGPFGQMGEHLLAAIKDSNNANRLTAEHEIRGISSINGIPTYARRMTKELLERTRHLETILESLNEAIVELYAGHVVYANSAAVKLFSVPLETILSSDLRELFIEASRNRIDALIYPELVESPVVVGVTHPLELNGRQIIVRSFPVEGENDTTILLITDVTEQRSLEYQLQHARRMDAIGNIAGGIAHNFNNLLMGIQGNASILSQSLKIGDPGFNELASIERCVDSGAKLTRQLLSFARGGRYSMDVVDLNEIVEKTSSMFARTKQEIHVTTHPADHPPMVEVDSAQIELVLMDLYVNAWHAMVYGGTLTVSVTHEILDETFLKPYDLDPGDYLKISVSDTGSGMDKETIARIFEPFYSTRHMAESTGLGLASVFGIIKKHQGFIMVESCVGYGTTFFVFLPVAKAVGAPKKVVQPEDAALSLQLEKGVGTILVVDDEKIILDAANILLKELGYDVLLADGGEEAVRTFEENKNRIDLLILDLVMPDLGGEVVYERIKKSRPDIPVILSSGYGIEEQAESMLKGSRDGFIQKPYNLIQLAQQIKETLRH